MIRCLKLDYCKFSWLLMSFFKFLHAFYQSSYAFQRHCIVARSTETTNRTVTFDTNHTSFGCKFHKVSLKFFVFVFHYETDVHVRTVFVTCNCSTEQTVTIDFTIKQFSSLYCTTLHFNNTTLSLDPTKSQHCRVDRQYRRSIEH